MEPHPFAERIDPMRIFSAPARILVCPAILLFRCGQECPKVDTENTG